MQQQTDVKTILADGLGGLRRAFEKDKQMTKTILVRRQIMIAATIGLSIAAILPVSLTTVCAFTHNPIGAAVFGTISGLLIGQIIAFLLILHLIDNQF
jgi:hypothetical protein